MKIAFRSFFVVAVLALCTTQPAHSQEAAPAYVVSYFETAPAASEKALKLAKRLAAESRKDGGNVRFELLQRIHQPNHFAILELWKGKDAHAAHVSAAHTKEFREKLAGLLRSPYDERPHTGLSVSAQQTAEKGSAKPPAVYAVTHVDIVPTEKDKGIGFVTELAQGSRGERGVLRFDVLQQNSRPNHLTVVELWQDQRAIDTHGVTDHTKQFREKLTPLSGSLYDERLYRLIK